MKITKERLLEKGFTEIVFNNKLFYVKDKMALFYDFNSWIPCHNISGFPLMENIYINDDMDELEKLMQKNNCI